MSPEPIKFAERLGLLSEFDQGIFILHSGLLISLASVLMYMVIINLNLLRSGYKPEIIYQIIMSFSTALWTYLRTYANYFSSSILEYSVISFVATGFIVLAAGAYLGRIYLILKPPLWIKHLTITPIYLIFTYQLLVSIAISFYGVEASGVVYDVRHYEFINLDSKMIPWKIVSMDFRVHLVGLICLIIMAIGLTYIVIRNFKTRELDSYVTIGLILTITINVSFLNIILRLAIFSRGSKIPFHRKDGLSVEGLSGIVPILQQFFISFICY